MLVAGCYQPRVPIGAACSSEGLCPNGQTCVAKMCVLPGTPEPDAAIDAAPPVDAWTWAMPTKVPGVNSTSVEDDPSCTPDRLTIVFTSDRNGTSDIFLGTRPTTADSFVVAPLDALNSTTANDGSPEISADGTTIYFTSDRVTAGSSDIYVSHKVSGVWSAPVLVTEWSTAGNEGDLAISPDELTAMIARSGKLLIATRASTTAAFGAPVAVPSLDVLGTALAGPSITNNADAVYFHAGNIRDLYYAKRVGNAYTTPMPITELNTSVRDDAPFISADEHYLLYAHANDIYETTR